MKKLLLISTITVALFTGCAMKNQNAPISSTDVAAAIASAQTKYNLAHEEMVAWGKTKSLIVKAKKLAATDPKKALALANEAAYQADTALAQSAEFEKTWRAAVPQ